MPNIIPRHDIPEPLLNSGELSRNALISTINNRTTIVSGTFKALSPLWFSDDWQVKSKAENQLVDTLARGFITATDRKRISQAIKTTISAILANCAQSKRLDAPITYSRVTAAGNKLLAEIIDYLAEQGILMTVIGKANQYQKATSWFEPLDAFNLLLVREQVKVEINKGANFLILRAKRKDGEKKGRKLKINKSRYELHSLSAPVVAYNAMWLRHRVTLAGHEINPHTRRIFNEALNLGGRFYGTYQQLTKAQRSTLKIGGSDTVEVDVSAMHPSILYAREGIQLSGQEIKEMYNVEGYDRSVIKLATLVLLNSESISTFKANITKSGNPSVKALKIRYDEETQHLKALKARHKGKLSDDTRKHIEAAEKRRKSEKAILEGFKDGMPDGIDGGELYKALCEKHKRIAHHFGTKHIGLGLQFTDSQIMASALMACTALNLPVLPVHDSLVCRDDDKAQVINLFQEAFFTHCGTYPVITD